MLYQSNVPYQLAQVDIARARASLADPLLADFASRLDEVYKLAETAPGFIWRLRAEDVSSTIPPVNTDERLFATISTWSSLEALKSFVYGGEHRLVMQRRREWFETLHTPFIALWWVPTGHRPDLAEVGERLHCIRTSGPTPLAFSFVHAFPMPAKGETLHPISPPQAFPGQSDS